jgi:hypothetical protein
MRLLKNEASGKADCKSVPKELEMFVRHDVALDHPVHVDITVFNKTGETH